MPYKKWRIKANLPPQKALREQQQSEMAQLIRSIQVAEKEKLFLVRQKIAAYRLLYLFFTDISSFPGKNSSPIRENEACARRPRG